MSREWPEGLVAGRAGISRCGVGEWLAMKDEPEFVSLRRAAALSGISAGMLRRLIKEGELPGYQIGRGLKVRMVELIRWAQGQRVQPRDKEHADRVLSARREHERRIALLKEKKS